MRSTSARLLVVAALCLGACPGRSEPFEPPADGDADLDGDASRDGELAPDGDGRVDGGDAGPVPEGSPVTFVVAEMALSTARLCDLDGDGSLDNAIADLGSPAGEMAIMALQSVLGGSASGEIQRVLVHLPFVADAALATDPVAVLVMGVGLDSDEPPDSTDDLLGDERFWMAARSLDACGEPLSHCAPVELDRGEARGECSGTLFVNSAGLPLRIASFEGAIATEGAGAELSVCAFMLAREAGAVPAPAIETDLTLLEVLLGGGASLGLPAIPGVAVDIDLDGDGLESFVLDADYHVSACLDGDLTPVAGRDCWQDPRIADGFAMTATISAVSADFLGREPGWEELVTGPCPDAPDPSLFDPI